MKPLIVLLSVFVVSTVIFRIVGKDWNLSFSGNLAMFLMLMLTASGHILFTRGMTMMLPPFIPFKTPVIYLTGIAEVLLGAALLFPSFRHIAGIALIVFFILLLPANIYAAFRHVDIEQATYTGPGLAYLWFRIPLQLLFIGWLVYFSL
jgi:uncharacterized membrane protein